MNKSESIGNLVAALSVAQAKIKGAVKDSNNPFFKSRYADLASIWDACREPLSANGLAVIQTTSSADDGAVLVETILAHKSNEWISGVLRAKPLKDEPQAIGSAITYLRRYALAAIVGVCPEDDDAESAHGRVAENQPAPPRPSEKSKPLPPPADDPPQNLEKLKKLLSGNAEWAEAYLRDFINAKGKACAWLLPNEKLDALSPDRVKSLLDNIKEFTSKVQDFAEQNKPKTTS